ncbi:MAG: aspartate aminotransferase family protein [Pirellulales bacterium]|nr:aspartate aminotransferase family protein [Pirellulales bacterium]
MSRVLDVYRQACESLASGVSSSTRVNRALGHALLFDRAEGAHLWDLDGHQYFDLCCSHGATLLGHGDSRVRMAVEQALDRGAPCSYENELHGELARLLCESVPCLERVRYTGAGTEATLHCLRLARAYTGRTRLLMFEGNFHGYHDQVMFVPSPTVGNDPSSDVRVSATSTGVMPGLERNLLVVPYNRPDLLEEAFRQHGHELAAAICEPVFYNAGCVKPTAEFMTSLRRLTREHGTVLIFDEVLCAFRMGPGGAQEYLGVTPDLCTLGKAVGGGYPLSVFGGRREIMDRLMPQGDCQHSGTYNGHPVAVAAALAAVRAYREPGFYDHIRAIGERLFAGMKESLARHGVPGRVQGLGARCGIYFGITDEVRDYRDAQQHDRVMMLRFIKAAIDRGVYLHDYGGAPCHHGFCAATTMADVDAVLDRLDDAIGSLRAPA